MAYFLLGIGLAALLAAFLLGRRVLEVRGWPTAEATVTERGVGLPDQPTGGARNARFVPRLALAYEVAGQRHTSTGRSTVQETMTEADAQAWVDAIPDRTAVHYNPADPSEAYLEAGSLAPALIAGVLGLLAAAAGAVTLFGAA
jgi:hypothetical protein